MEQRQGEYQFDYVIQETKVIDDMYKKGIWSTSKEFWFNQSLHWSRGILWALCKQTERNRIIYYISSKIIMITYYIFLSRLSWLQWIQRLKTHTAQSLFDMF